MQVDQSGLSWKGRNPESGICMIFLCNFIRHGAGWDAHMSLRPSPFLSAPVRGTSYRYM